MKTLEDLVDKLNKLQDNDYTQQNGYTEQEHHIWKKISFTKQCKT